MILIVCNDDKNGMMFNNRRQSRDIILINDIIQTVKDENKLYCSLYTSKLFFDETDFRPQICENTVQVPKDCYLFAEHPSQIPNEKNIQKIIRYLWNRSYPSDNIFTLNLDEWKLEFMCDFVGYSHERITKEIYKK